MSADGDRAHIAIQDIQQGLAGRVDGQHTFWVRTRLYNVQQPHVADIVNVYLHFQHNYQRFSVELDSEDGGREQELAYHRVALIAILSWHSRGWEGGLHTFVLTIWSFRGLD